MTMSEFWDWWAYYQIQPFGEQRGDIRIGLLGDGIAQLLGSRRSTPQSFMPTFDKEPKQQTPEQMKQIAQRFAQQYNAHKRKR